MNNTFHLDAELKQIITPDQAFQYRIIPVSKSNEILKFRTDSKDLDALKNELTIILGVEVELIDEASENLQSFLQINYRQKSSGQSENLNYQSDFLNVLLQTAKDYNSSDIHLEIYENKCRVRFRLDGKLKEQFVISSQEYPQIINQIKIRAGLDISQKRLSQDGRLTVTSENIENQFDIRVSTLPTLYGEKIVLRILKKDGGSVDLSNLGFTEKELRVYREATKKPNGIILISGPTGSGKTTTLYGTLKELNKPTTNILTIEDPIEYTLNGINQVQLKEDIGFDFPSALRTFLRQDPDIIMVGEIRDEATANMAIKAALTGHLVLSTIHTNSAWATISRLVDMGIPPFLIASTLNLSMAQRLVRLLCPSCKKEIMVKKDAFPINFKIPSDLHSYYKAVGCNDCYSTGYRGRKAIYEIIPMDTQSSKFIKENASNIDQIDTPIRMISLKDNALRLLRNGETSIDEIYSLLN